MKKIIILFIIIPIILVLAVLFYREKGPAVPPKDIVDVYMKCTLEGISGCPSPDDPHILAKEHLVPELQEQFIDSSFVLLSYCLEHEPNDVKILSEEISGNTAIVRVQGFYVEWQELWEFGLVIDKNKWKIKEIKCAPFSVVYSNAKYGFSLEYPDHWHKIGDSETDVISFTSQEQEPLIEIFVSENHENLDIEEWISWIRAGELSEDAALIKKQEILVAGTKAIKEEAAVLTSVYLAKDNYIIQINYTGGEYRDFSLLLDSLRFE